MTDYAFPSLYSYITDRGIVLPDTSSIKSSVENAIKGLFGADFDVTPETPAGRLVEAITVLMAEAIGVNAQNANQYNIYQSIGAFLDAYGALWDVSRMQASGTRTTIVVEGTAQTIPAGTLIATEDGDEFAVETDITLQDGTGAGYAVSVEKGPIPCPTGKLTRKVSAVIGWTSVVNTNDPITYGTDVETDASYRSRILSARGKGAASVEAIANAIYAIPSKPSSVAVFENGYSHAIVKNGVTINPKTVFACVYGGNEGEIARAIFNTKTAGAGYTPTAGDATQTSAVVQDEVSGTSYTVYFCRPMEIAVEWKVWASKSVYTGIDIVATVCDAIRKYVGSIGIGGSVSVIDCMAETVKTLPSGVVKGIEMRIGGAAHSEYRFPSYRIPRTVDANITVIAE